METCCLAVSMTLQNMNHLCVCMHAQVHVACVRDGMRVSDACLH